ncbi:MAG: mechanosensitive ion channel family protein [Spirochaetales bacterium]|nr:mechanosensitive ion channel family protein [Spirochaetales bacterium]
MFDQINRNEVLSQVFNSDNFKNLTRALIYFVIGLILIRLTVAIVQKITRKRVSRQSSMIVNKIISYSGMTVLLFVVLSELGVNVTALLGAAGILGIALGVASQKSIGNMVSGFFLLSEKPFEVGDAVKINGQVGSVMDVDLLAVKIKTFDNMLVRIPNEVIISNEVINITRFPLRRLDTAFTVAYGTDLTTLEATLRALALEIPLILDEPDPFFLIKDFTERGITLTYGVWFLKENYADVKNAIAKAILSKLDELDMKIPYPRFTISTDQGEPR